MLAAVPISALLILAAAWYRAAPPSDRTRWQWVYSEFNPSDGSNIVLGYGAVGSRSKGLSIGYLVRIRAEPKDMPLRWVPEWFQDVDGRVYVGGRSIPYSDTEFRLFVGDKKGPTRLIYLDEHQKKLFQPNNNRFKSFESLDKFWNEVVP